MSFKDWIFSSYPNPSIDGQWGILHILVLIFCIATIVLASFLLRNKSEKSRKIYLIFLASLILIFELTRRIVNFIKMTNPTFNSVMYALLPRPLCAISCWTLIISVIVNKKFFYNFASMISLLSSLIFFAYPGAGFNNVYILFENLYSIATHSLLLIMSISLITLKFTKFEYKSIWKEAIVYLIVLIYSFIEIYVLKIEPDPMYFMPNNDVQEIFGIGYAPFLVIYVVFNIIYFNVFYLINDRKNLFNKK